MGGLGAAVLLLIAAPFIIAFVIFLVATRNSPNEGIRSIRFIVFATIAAVMVIGGVQDFIADVRRPPVRHILHIHHEFASVEGCEPVGAGPKATTLVTIAFDTNLGYDHPVPLYKDENHFEKMKLVQLSGRVVTEDGQRNEAQDFFPLPLEDGSVAADQVFAGTVEVPGHGRCEIDLVIAREVEPVRLSDD